MKKLIYLSICLGMTVLMSCGDDNGPEITITSPGDGDTFTATDSIVVTFGVTDDIDVASISINTPGFFTTTVNGLEGESDTNVTLSDVVAVNDTPAGDYSITITATDNEGNEGSDSVDITIQ